MSTEGNKAIVHRYVEDGYNRGNMAVFDELFAVDFVNHDPAQPAIRDREGLKALCQAQRAAFADVRTTIDEMLIDGDRVVKRFMVRGTHTGTFNGIPPTGKQFTLAGIDILRVVDGQIREIWWGYDTLGMLQQLGVLPQPQSVGA
ncbi:MAG: ester cyclase [Chloroflexota bacterium]